MNQTNKMKKAERKFLLLSVNFFSLLGNGLVGFFKFVFSALNQKITIMFVPHSEKRVFNFRVNIFLLFMFFFVVFSSVGVITVLSINNYKKSVQYSRATYKTQLYENQSKKYNSLITSLLDSHGGFEIELNSLLTRLNSPTIRFIQKNHRYNLNQGGTYGKDSNFSESKEMRTKEYEINKIKNEYDYAIQAFREINRMVDNYNKILVDLPYGSPVKGFYTITSRFGFRIHPIFKVLDMHQGIDLAYKMGTPIMSTAPGVVDRVSWNPGGYGWYCKITHKLGFSTLYAHMMSQPLVKQGQKVKKYQIIGYMGMTGLTTGTHLHYEVHLGNSLLDPSQFISNY